MKTITDYTVEELQAELARRQSQPTDKIQPLATPDFSHVVKACEAYVDELYNDHYDNVDHRQWIYEAALEAVFGDGIWQWKNMR